MMTGQERYGQWGPTGARVLVAGVLAEPAALVRALEQAWARHPDGTLVYVREEHLAPTTAAKWWIARGGPIDPVEAPEYVIGVLWAEVLLTGIDHDGTRVGEPIDLAVCCTEAWRPFGRNIAIGAYRLGIPVIEVDHGLVGPARSTGTVLRDIALGRDSYGQV